MGGADLGARILSDLALPWSTPPYYQEQLPPKHGHILVVKGGPMPPAYLPPKGERVIIIWE